MCSILYSSAARFVTRTKHLNVWHEHGRSNVGPVHLGRQQCTRMPSLFSPCQEGKPQHQHRRAAGPSLPSRYLVGSSQGWMMCDPVREHRFRSCHTVYSVHFVHGRHTGPSPLRRRVRALRRLRRALTLPQPSVACTLLVPANIRATTRRYRKVRHTQITLRNAIVRQLCYPSKISSPIVVKLAFSLRRHFFQRGLRHLISRERYIARIIWKTARANYPKNAGDYPIAIHHQWHVTNGSSVDAVGGQQSLVTAAAREI